MKLLMIITLSLFIGTSVFAASKKKSSSHSGQSMSIEGQSPEVCEHNLASLDRNSSTAYKPGSKNRNNRKEKSKAVGR